MRILLVSNYFPEHVGGIQTVADNLARGYRRRGHRVVWAAAEVTPHRGHQDDLSLAAWNLTEEHLGFPYPLVGPGAVGKLLRAVGQSDAVHVQDCLYQTSAIAVIAASLQHKRVLVTQHVGIVPYRQRALRIAQQAAYRSLGRVVLGRADHITFVSRAVAGWFSTFVPKARTAEVVSNGVDSTIFKPLEGKQRAALRVELGLPSAGPVLLFTGRFVQKKGLHLLEPVVRRHPAWTLVLIGQPSDVDPRTWALPNVRVLPTMPASQLSAYYQAADLLTIPSTGEGFPVAVQEAMACATPAVLSAELKDALPWSVAFTSERTAEAVEATVTRALDTLAADQDMRQRVARYARDHWNWDATIDRYEAMLAGADPGQQGEQPAAVARS